MPDVFKATGNGFSATDGNNFVRIDTEVLNPQDHILTNTSAVQVTAAGTYRVYGSVTVDVIDAAVGILDLEMRLNGTLDTVLDHVNLAQSRNHNAVVNGLTLNGSTLVSAAQNDFIGLHLEGSLETSAARHDQRLEIEFLGL